jgi:hypothetical protein
MTVWALDLATLTGECWGGPSALPTLGHNKLPSTGEDVGHFLHAFEGWVLRRLDEIAPTLIVFEAPVLPRPKFNPVTKKVEGGVSLITTRKLQGIAGTLEKVAYAEGLDCREVQPAEAKQALTGKGNAKKHQMVAGARAFGLNPHTYQHEGADASDEADAFGVWLFAVRIRYPAELDRWAPRTPLFAGAA